MNFPSESVSIQYMCWQSKIMIINRWRSWERKRFDLDCTEKGATGD